MVKNNKLFYEVKKPLLSWEDIGGYKDVKEKLKDLVCLSLQKFDELRKLNIDIPKGIMLWGPLGTGITMLAEAAAKEAGATFIYVSGQEMLGKPEVVREAFFAARQKAPSVLFFSDNDWLVPRVGADYEWESGNSRGKPPTFADKELTATYISEIDRLQSEEQKVMLVGSAYRIDVVDQSIIKEKRRFNRKIFVHPPVKEDLKEMLNIYIKKIGMKFNEDIKTDKIVDQIEGYTGWDVENLCRKARVLALKRNIDIVTYEDFMDSLQTITPWLTGGMTKKYKEIFLQDCPHHYNF